MRVERRTLSVLTRLLQQRLFLATTLAAFLFVPVVCLWGQTGSVRVHLVDAQTRSPIANAEITVRGRVRVAALTDGEGTCLMRGVAPGRYTVHVRSLGYAAATLDTVIAAGQSHTHVIPLDLLPIPLRAIHANARTPWAPLSSVRFGRGDSLGVANAEAWLRIAKALAGTTLGHDRLYVDGLHSVQLPDLEDIAQLSINADPFSVRYSESDQNVIDIVSTDPQRTFRWDAAYSLRPIGARNPLAPRLATKRTTGNLGVSAGVPLTPVAFSARAAFTDVFEERPAFGSPDSEPNALQTAPFRSESQQLSLALAVGSRGRSRARISVTASTSNDTGAETGGFVQAERAASISTRSIQTRFIAEMPVRRLRYQTGVGFGSGEDSFNGATSRPAINVIDAFSGGGAPFAEMRLESTDWHWTNIIAMPQGASLAGWSLGRIKEAERIVPNPHGEVLLGTPQEYAAWQNGGQAGAWSRTSETTQQEIVSSTFAAFAEHAWRISSAHHLRLGLRSDYQTHDGVKFSPRLSLASVAGPWMLTGAIGIFRQDIFNAVRLQAERFDTAHAPLRAYGHSVRLASGSLPLYSAADDDFTRPRSIVARTGLQFQSNSVGAGVEYTWNAGSSRAGSRRIRMEDALIDLLESNRRLRRHHLHLALSYSSRPLSVVARYEWLTSRDDSEGPFSFPERQHAVASEWARSTGVPPHNLSVTTELMPLFGVRSILLFSARSAAPFNVRSGLDPEGLGLYNDRGGLARNSGRGPPFRSLDAYLQRRIRIPYARIAGRQPAFEISARVDNLLGARNYVAVGSNSASPFMNRPVAALPGRALHWSLRLLR